MSPPQSCNSRIRRANHRPLRSSQPASAKLAPPLASPRSKSPPKPITFTLTNHIALRWLFNFLFSLVTPYMIKAWGSYTFTFYAILDIIMATLVFLFLKETKGKSIEEMETIFNSKAAFDVEAVHRKTLEGGGDDSGLDEISVPVDDKRA